MVSEKWTRLLGIVGTVLAFLWGVYVWQSEQATQRDAKEQEQSRTAETRRVEATRPFLDLQLKLYAEVAQVAAILGA